MLRHTQVRFQSDNRSNGSSSNDVNDSLSAPSQLSSFLRTRADRALDEGKMSREAYASYQELLANMPKSLSRSLHQTLEPDLASVASATAGSSSGGDSGDAFDKMSRFQQQQLANKFASLTAVSVANEIRRQINDANAQKALTEEQFTGENYWMEASDFFTDFEVPSFLKDEVYEDMKRDRKVDPTTGQTAAEYVSEDDLALCEELKAELELSKQEKEAPEVSNAAPSRTSSRREESDNIPKFE